MNRETVEPTFWDVPVPKRRRKHRTADTSRDGRLAVASRLPTQRATVLNVLRALGPMTRHELAAVTHLPLSSICGRVAELVKAGSIVEQTLDGKRVRRDGRHVLMAAYQVRRAG